VGLDEEELELPPSRVPVLCAKTGKLIIKSTIVIKRSVFNILLISYSPLMLLIPVG
jgi:hypothetical protein